MFATRQLIISKTIVGISWVLGLAELAHPYLHIPPVWLYVVMALSLLAHGAQCIYFVRRFGHAAKPVWPHLLQIMVFGMPHVVDYAQKHKAGGEAARA